MSDHKTDWEAIEREYRAGQLSIREIARFYEVSDTAIRKRAKTFDWERDLSTSVDQATRVEMLKAEAREQKQDPTYVAKDKELVDVAAKARVDIVLGHRKDAKSARCLVVTLWDELRVVTANVELFADQVALIAKDPAGNAAAQALSKAISLPRRASAARSLAQALATLVTVEREAFGMGVKGEDGDVVKEPMMMCFDGKARS